MMRVNRNNDASMWVSHIQVLPAKTDAILDFIYGYVITKILNIDPQYRAIVL